MRKVSVSNLDYFRTWKSDEDADIFALMERLQGQFRPTPAMQAGTAFHEALENSKLGDFETLTAGPYRFDIECDCAIPLGLSREIRIGKAYGDLYVSGRVDCLLGKVVSDHKTTANFDADRLMSGYQWRYYLDMLELDIFQWNVFVLREVADDPMHYVVSDFHALEQRRYPGLENDCARLAGSFYEFAKSYLPVMA